MKRFAATILSIFLLFTAIGCSSPDDTVDPDAEVQFLIVLVTDRSGIDYGVNASCWAGLQRAAEELEASINVEYLDGSKMSYADCFKEAVDMEPDLIICPSSDMAGVLAAVAEQYIDDLFIIFDAEIPDAFNTTTVSFNPEQSAYLAGMVAALCTESDVVGFIGSEANELSYRYLYGFTAGVVNTSHSVYISTNYINSTNDSRKAKETAVAQFKLGADVIFHAAGSAGTGVVTAAAERGFKAITLLPEQAVSNPDAVLCTIAKNGEKICFDIVKRLTEGTFDGSTLSYSIAEDAFYVDNSQGNISEEDMQFIDEQIEKIKNGMVVPYDNISYQTFINDGEPLPVDESDIINTDPEMDI